MTSACIQVGVAIFISVSASQTLVFNPRPANDALSAAVAIRRRKVRATRDPRHHPAATATPPIRGITGDDCARHGTTCTSQPRCSSHPLTSRAAVRIIILLCVQLRSRSGRLSAVHVQFRTCHVCAAAVLTDQAGLTDEF